MSRGEWLGKSFLVVGASSAMGIEICTQLLASGAQVIANSRRLEPLSHLREQYGEILQIISVDISDIGSGQVIAKEIGERRLAGFVYCAGKLSISPVKFFKHDDFTSIMRVNCEAFLETCQALLRKSLLQKGASVVAISSVMEKHAIPGNALYSASKAALTAAMKVLALELARERIRVNAVSPGALDSGMTNDVAKVLSADAATKHASEYPLGSGTAKDVANLAAFLLSDSSPWITGASMVVDGGFSCR